MTGNGAEVEGVNVSGDSVISMQGVDVDDANWFFYQLHFEQ